MTDPTPSDSLSVAIREMTDTQLDAYEVLVREAERKAQYEPGHVDLAAVAEAVGDLPFARLHALRQEGINRGYLERPPPSFPRRSIVDAAAVDDDDDDHDELAITPQRPLARVRIRPQSVTPSPQPGQGDDKGPAPSNADQPALSAREQAQSTFIPPVIVPNRGPRWIGHEVRHGGST